MRPRHDARLVPAALAAYACAWTVLVGLAQPSWWGAVAAATAVFGLMCRRNAGSIWVACAVVGAIAASASFSDAVRWTGGIASAVDSGKSVGFDGTVVGEPQPIGVARYGAEDERWKVVLAVNRWADDGAASHPASAQIVVFGDAQWSRVGYGDAVAATGRLSTAGTGRPIALAWDAQISTRRDASRVPTVVSHFRDSFRRDASTLSPLVRGLTVGMVIGDTSDMAESQVRDMRTTGLTHLTAVSGSHFAVLALALGFFARCLRWRRPARVIVLALAMACFVALVFPSASVVRAAWMGGVVVVALAWGRPAQALPALASAVIGLLFVDPFLALSYGFVLSVLATAAIALWAPILATFLCRFLTPRLARIVAVPLAAQVACTPVIVLLNPGLGPYAVPANLVAVPCAAATTIIGLMGVLASALSPPVGHILASAASLPAWPIAWAARGFAGAPYSWLPWPSGTAGALLAAMVAGTLIVATSARRVVGWARIAAALAVFGVIGASPPLRAVLSAGAWSAPPEWRIAVCDVGQGDAVLLRSGANSAVMIDVGPPGGSGLGCLRSHGVTSVPLLILTHPHADHDGAIREVVAAVAVDRAWVAPIAGDGSNERAAMALREEGVPTSTPPVGTSVVVGWVRLTTWYGSRLSGTTSAGVNDSSLVTWGDADGVTFLELGDLQATGQAALSRVAGLSLGVDVVKIAHHGSASQDPGLAAALSARLAVVSVGAGNPYGHPSEVALAEYSRAGTLVLRTDECGEVDVQTGGAISVSADCPSVVAGWGHGGTGRAPDEPTGVGPSGPGSARSGRRPRAGSRRASGCGDRRGRALNRRDGVGEQALRRQLRIRSPPRRNESQPLRRAGRRRRGGGRGDERCLRRRRPGLRSRARSRRCRRARSRRSGSRQEGP